MARVLTLMILTLSASCWAAQDPTAPLGWAQPQSTLVKPKKKTVHRLPTLQSIVCEQAKACSAVLNGEVVQRGDVVNGYKISKINNENLFLQRAGKQWKLGLFAMDVKH
ncbi:MSHA biogenesis protein MshK [Vibrio hangzhouensis]|uniref:MSHA biogenesis protein MshK n=1 Tax=Vibrio hangzhouensis TaxID=462991 RepID=A0A1H5U5S4_9VIBR|nr:MSHA biogenesis protein MshK [Vibrio hangzhouensis]SEF70350.1 MSHA biogenesis protein MshK [Vibrio hangzhouensis]